jgi:hypothetical protein
MRVFLTIWALGALFALSCAQMAIAATSLNVP